MSRLDREKAGLALRGSGATPYALPAVLDALEECVTEDPRIARILALCDEVIAADRPYGDSIDMAIAVRDLIHGVEGAGADSVGTGPHTEETEARRTAPASTGAVVERTPDAAPREGGSRRVEAGTTHGIWLTADEAAVVASALRLANAYEAHTESTFGEEEHPVRAKWRAIAERLEAAS